MLCELDEVVVIRNDIPLEQIQTRASWSALVLSPGPGLPDGAGSLMQVLGAYQNSLPILGVCLGHEAIAVSRGGRLSPSPTIFHGRTSEVFHSNKGIFSGLPNPFRAVRYHSWQVDRKSLPASLEITAWTESGEIMGLQEKNNPNLSGVQFHPESALTEGGMDLLRNFFRLVTI